MMRMNIKIVSAFLLGSSLISTSFAEESLNNFMLDEITIEGQREFDFNNKTFVNAKDLSQRQANQISDIFSTHTEIDVGGGGLMAQKIYVRGVEDRLLRVTIDGAAQNGNAFHHQGNTVIDPGMLKSIEITKGSANASAGPGALAGAISMTTKDASDLLDKGQNFGFNLGSSFYTNFGVRENVTLYGRTGTHFDVLLYYTYQNIFYFLDGNHAFKNIFNPTEDDKVLGSNSIQNNALLKANYYINEKNKMTFTYNLTTDSAIRPFRANITSASEDGIQFSKEIFRHENSNNNAIIEYNRSGGQNFGNPNFKVNGYASIRNIYLTPRFNPYNTFATSDTESLGGTGAGGSHASSSGDADDKCPHNDYACLDPEGTTPRNIYLNNFGLDLKVSHSIANNYKNTLDYGLNYQHMTTQDKAQEITTKDLRGQEDANIVGAYIQANYTLAKILTIGAGTRYDVYNYFDKNSYSHLTQGFSPSVAILYNPIQSVDMKLSYTYVTRGALPGDALLLQDKDVPIDRNLKSEKGQNVELDIDYTQEHFSLRGAVYYQIIDDFINTYGKDADSLKNFKDEEATGKTPDLEDVESSRSNLKDKINVYGFEAGASFNYENFLTTFAVSRSFPTVRGALIQDTYELGAISGFTYALNLSYRFPSLGLSLSWLSKFVQKIDEKTYNIYWEEFDKIKKEGYNTHSLYVNYNPPKFKAWNFSLVLNNIFNAQYIDQTSPLRVEGDGRTGGRNGADINKIIKALPNPGFDARFQISYKF